MSRWEERLQDVFKVMPYGFKDEVFKMLGFKDEVFKMLMNKMQLRVTLDGRKKPANY
jgi:hypothetical protein